MEDTTVPRAGAIIINIKSKLGLLVLLHPAMAANAPPTPVLFTGALAPLGALRRPSCPHSISYSQIPRRGWLAAPEHRLLPPPPPPSQALPATLRCLIRPLRCPLSPFPSPDLDGTCVHYDIHEFAHVEEQPSAAGLYPATSLDGAQRTLLLRLPPSTSGVRATAACWLHGDTAFH